VHFVGLFFVFIGERFFRAVKGSIILGNKFWGCDNRTVSNLVMGGEIER